MKNIHVLPTPKPRFDKYLVLNKESKPCIWNTETMGSQNTLISQNIYITNSEEIKEGDWKLDTFHNQISKVTNMISVSKYDKKIILTTDPDLIKGGVQAIDDTFLEWFVKNPSCEFVKVGNYVIGTGFSHVGKTPSKEESLRGCYDNGEQITGKWEDCYKYKIIIPQEEPKTNLERLSFPELVEEFAEYYKSIPLIEEPKQTRTIVDELKAYFENTPEDKIQSDWDETCKQTEGIDSPTVSEFMEAQKQFNEQETLEEVEENIDREEWINFFKNNSKEEILEYLINYKFPL